jgi:Polyketide cyclase / dehydrase and lipid transport
MTVIENSVQIDRSMEDVFDFTGDPRNELQWNPEVESMEKITDGPIDVGSKFRAKWKQSGLVEIEVTRYDRPRSWSYHNDGPLSVDLDCTIMPNDTGSGVVFHSRFDVRPHGKLKLFFPILLRSLKRTEKNNMGYIKEALEGE